jgi:hypothetical protein
MCSKEQCGKVWTRKFLSNTFTKVFIDKKYKLHQEQILFEKELALMPSTQLLIERRIYKRKKIEDYNQELSDINKIMNELIERKTDVERLKRVLMYDLDNNIEEEFKKLGLSKQAKSSPVHMDVNDKKEEDIKKAINLVELLKDDRADNYQDWIRVGWALHNIHIVLLDTWIEFSKRSHKFKDGECEKKWKSFKKDKKLTCASLLHMLKEDDKDKFLIIYKKLNIKKLIMERKQHFPNNELLIDNIILIHIQMLLFKL